LKKNDYTPGEVACMVSEADNSNCKVDVQNIEGIFNQVLKITSQGFTDQIYIQHQTVAIPGIKAGESQVGQNARRIQVPLKTGSGGGVQPTSRGKLVINEYHLANKLVVDLCCENDPTCEITINVRNADFVYEKWAAQPTNWNPQVMGVYNAQFTTDFQLKLPLLPQSQEFTPGNQIQFPTNPGSPMQAYPGNQPQGIISPQSISPPNLMSPQGKNPQNGLAGVAGMPIPQQGFEANKPK